MNLNPTNRPISRLGNPGWLQLFADPPAPDATDPNATGGGQQPDKVKLQIEGKPKSTDPPAPAPISFPDQASLNDRLARAGKSALEKAAKDAGFENAEAMATAAKAAKAADEAAKTEQQKLAEAKEAAEKRATEAEAKTAETQTKSDQKVIKAEVRSLARVAGAVDVEDVLKLMDSKDIKLDEEGNVTGVQEAIDALKTAKPHLFGTAKPSAPPMGGGMNPPRTPPANMMDASHEELAANVSQYGIRLQGSSRDIKQTRKG